MYQIVNDNLVRRVADNLVIPRSDDNPAYRECLEWEAAGNTLAPADPPPQPSAQEQIDVLERTHLLPRVTREFMLLQFAAVAAANNFDPMQHRGYAKLKALDDQIAALRAKL